MLSRREELLKVLRATPVVLRTVVRDLDDAEWRRRPAPGEWAAVEVEALRRFDAIRAEHVALLASLDDAGWRRTGVHSEQGPMDVELYETHTAGEDVDHMAQIARLVDGG